MGDAEQEDTTLHMMSLQPSNHVWTSYRNRQQEGRPKGRW